MNKRLILIVLMVLFLAPVASAQIPNDLPSRQKFSYRGTSQADVKKAVQVEGMVAAPDGALTESGSIVPGNPDIILTGGQYNATAPTLSDKEVSIFQLDSSGNLKTSTSGGSAAGGGSDNKYSSPIDFTVSVVDGTTDLLLSRDSLGGFDLTTGSFSNATVKVRDQSATPAVDRVITMDGHNFIPSTKRLETANCTGSFTFASGDTVTIEGVTGGYKTIDPNLAIQKNIEQSPISSKRVNEGDILNAAQDLSHSGFFDVGPEIDVRGFTKILAGVNLDINGGTNVQIRALGKFASGATREYSFAIETISASKVNVEDEVIEFTDDADQLILLKILSDGIDFIQFQAKEDDPGGAITPAQIDNLEIVKIWQ